MRWSELRVFRKSPFPPRSSTPALPSEQPAHAQAALVSTWHTCSAVEVVSDVECKTKLQSIKGRGLSPLQSYCFGGGDTWRYVRINMVTWNEHICMRAGMYIAQC